MTGVGARHQRRSNRQRTRHRAAGVARVRRRRHERRCALEHVRLPVHPGRDARRVTELTAEEAVSRDVRRVAVVLVGVIRVHVGDVRVAAVAVPPRVVRLERRERDPTDVQAEIEVRVAEVERDADAATEADERDERGLPHRVRTGPGRIPRPAAVVAVVPRTIMVGRPAPRFGGDPGPAVAGFPDPLAVLIRRPIVVLVRRNPDLTVGRIVGPAAVRTQVVDADDVLIDVRRRRDDPRRLFVPIAAVVEGVERIVRGRTRRRDRWIRSGTLRDQRLSDAERPRAARRDHVGRTAAHDDARDAVRTDGHAGAAERVRADRDRGRVDRIVQIATAYRT